MTGPGGPFEPHTGSWYVYSQIGDISYKRLTRTITVPAGGGSLDFWISRDTELDWDFVFVEARTPGRFELDDSSRQQWQHDPRVTGDELCRRLA